MFFLILMMMGSIISISSNSYLGMWMGLEINLLSFIPLIQEKMNMYSTESSLKYFLTQALASIIFLFSILMMSKNWFYFSNIDSYLLLIFNSSLLTKMGMAPFHFWFPEVIEGLNWMNCLILLSWQKITPMILIMYNMKFQYFFMMIIIFSMLISGIMNINQTSIRKILAYSSINHMAWMLSAMFFSETIWFYYLIIYIILTINLILLFNLLNLYNYNQLIMILKNNFLIKFIISMNFLSLGGLPPFFGFYSKWLTIQMLINSEWFLLSLIMVMTTLIMLYIYIKISFNILIFNNFEVNFLINSNNKMEMILIINFLTLISLIMMTYSFNFL
uniref:NADH-ubiquinone oxidoreductase chain 2 n=1 Tax=Staphylinoidea sp. 6 KM-2017 TaxID=2219460 RepID=A0A346RJU2_9COLE|nr:NADH dehydrogenase subunit 2 [Staphylinoidea sp. 6 KM-2017]